MVARLVAQGESNREIAEGLDITERTVKSHLTAIFEKLQVRDRVQLGNEQHLHPPHDQLSQSHAFFVTQVTILPLYSGFLYQSTMPMGVDPAYYRDQW